MKTKRLVKFTTTATLAVGIALPYSAANAGGPVCYAPVDINGYVTALEKLDADVATHYRDQPYMRGVPDKTPYRFPRLVYVPQHVADLTSVKGRRAGFGQQKLWDANGKVTNFPHAGAMRGFTGSVIRNRWAKPHKTQNGARLTGEISAVKLGMSGLSIPLELDCTSPELKVIPQYWQCNLTAAIFTVPVKLYKSDPDHDHNCNIFQDSKRVPRPPYGR